VGTGRTNLVKRIESILTRQSNLEDKLDKKNHKLLNAVKEQVLKRVDRKDGIEIVSALPNVDSTDLQQLADLVESEVTGVILLGALEEDSASVVCKVSDTLTEKFDAGKIVREAAEVLGGGGGGSSGFAQGGGPNKNFLEEALSSGVNIVKSSIESE